jgi:hypothetical protein
MTGSYEVLFELDIPADVILSLSKDEEERPLAKADLRAYTRTYEKCRLLLCIAAKGVTTDDGAL